MLRGRPQSLSSACRRRPPASASLQLPGVPEARRYRAKVSLASLAGCKSLSGKGEPPTRIESCVPGGVAIVATNKRGAKRRQRILEAAGVTAPPEVLGQLRRSYCGRRGFSRY